MPTFDTFLVATLKLNQILRYIAYFLFSCIDTWMFCALHDEKWGGEDERFVERFAWPELKQILAFYQLWSESNYFLQLTD